MRGLPIGLSIVDELDDIIDCLSDGQTGNAELETRLTGVIASVNRRTAKLTKLRFHYVLITLRIQLHSQTIYDVTAQRVKDLTARIKRVEDLKQAWEQTSQV